MASLEELQARVVDLGKKKIETRVARLESRRFFFFFRVRMLLKKIDFLRQFVEFCAADRKAK